MAFTRFHDDPSRLKKQAQISSFSGRYFLDTPGQGIDLPFLEDPNIRMQKWGANFRNNTVNLESDLLGLTRKINRDYIGVNEHTVNAVQSSPNTYRNEEPYIEESRATHPAWMYKDLEQSRWESPFLNPLNGLEKGFHENIQTRILEKDFFVPTIPIVNGTEHMSYYLTGKTICMNGDEVGCHGSLYNNELK
uniref:Uncharacterized protein n=1 Tax=viral metagenome TaxID=1070528 RepID=A0A6C0JKY4_9ZZZZ